MGKQAGLPSQLQIHAAVGVPFAAAAGEEFPRLGHSLFQHIETGRDERRNRLHPYALRPPTAPDPRDELLPPRMRSDAVDGAAVVEEDFEEIGGLCALVSARIAVDGYISVGVVENGHHFGPMAEIRRRLTGIVQPDRLCPAGVEAPPRPGDGGDFRLAGQGRALGQPGFQAAAPGVVDDRPILAEGGAVGRRDGRGNGLQRGPEHDRVVAHQLEQLKHGVVIRPPPGADGKRILIRPTGVQIEADAGRSFGGLIGLSRFGSAGGGCCSQHNRRDQNGKPEDAVVPPLVHGLPPDSRNVFGKSPLSFWERGWG